MIHHHYIKAVLYSTYLSQCQTIQECSPYLNCSWRFETQLLISCIVVERGTLNLKLFDLNLNLGTHLQESMEMVGLCQQCSQHCLLGRPLHSRGACDCFCQCCHLQTCLHASSLLLFRVECEAQHSIAATQSLLFTAGSVSTSLQPTAPDACTCINITWEWTQIANIDTLDGCTPVCVLFKGMQHHKPETNPSQLACSSVSLARAHIRWTYEIGTHLNVSGQDRPRLACHRSDGTSSKSSGEDLTCLNMVQRTSMK
jgi:hypothetical protein